MKDIRGALIHYYRDQKQYSQEGLCKGICAVSYLSKIEQGKVVATQEVYDALFKALSVSFYQEEMYIEKWKQKIINAFEAYYYEEECELDLIKKEADKLLHSPLCIDYVLLVVLYEKSSDYLTYAKYFKDYMNDMQYAFYLYLQTERVDDQQANNAINILKNAQKYYDWSILELRYGEILEFNLGDYSQAIDHFMRSYHLASEEGYLSGMIYASLQIGNCYACVNAEKTMLKYYTRCEHLIRSSKYKKLQGTIWYNIGSVYQEWNQYDKAEIYLLKAYNSNLPNDFLCYHKLILLYDKIDQEKALHYLNEAKQKYQEIRTNDSDEILHFLELHMHKEGQNSEEYVECLKNICEGDLYYYGVRYFHLPYYIEALKKKRRYKEALQIVEKYHYHRI